MSFDAFFVYVSIFLVAPATSTAVEPVAVVPGYMPDGTCGKLELDAEHKHCGWGEPRYGASSVVFSMYGTKIDKCGPGRGCLNSLKPHTLKSQCMAIKEIRMRLVSHQSPLGS